MKKASSRLISLSGLVAMLVLSTAPTMAQSSYNSQSSANSQSQSSANSTYRPKYTCWYRWSWRRAANVQVCGYR